MLHGGGLTAVEWDSANEWEFFVLMGVVVRDKVKDAAPLEREKEAL